MSTLKKRLRDMEAAVRERVDSCWVFVDVWEDRVRNRATGEEFDIEMLFHLAEMNPDIIFIPFVHTKPSWARSGHHLESDLSPDDLRAENAGVHTIPQPEDTRTPAEIEAEEASWAFWDEMARRSSRLSGDEPCPFGRAWPPSTVERDKLARSEEWDDEVEEVDEAIDEA